MYDKMFKATGGARMGMRARASQNGKLARTEGGKDGADAAPPTTASQGGQSVGSHKRKRADDAEGGAEAQVPASAESVVVKQEKTPGEAKTAVKQEGGEESAEPKTSAKAERKRERSEAKKAKRAAKEEGAKTPSGVEDGEAISGKEEKARKKKKKRAGKGA